MSTTTISEQGKAWAALLRGQLANAWADIKDKKFIIPRGKYSGYKGIPKGIVFDIHDGYEVWLAPIRKDGKGEILSWDGQAYWRMSDLFEVMEAPK